MKVRTGRVDDAFLPETVSQKVSSVLEVAAPEMDLIPVPVFVSMYGCKPEAYKVPVTAITRADGSQMSGVLVYAYMWNAPPGCFRIRTKEVFAIEKIKTLANSEESLWKTEVDDQFTASFAGHGDTQLTSQSLHLLSTRAS